MQYRRLGRTGLEVSLVGLGTGGPSRLGQGSGVPEAEAVRVVHRALDLGINLIDTSAGYGEARSSLGRALRQVDRRSYIIATKFRPRDEAEEDRQPAAALEESLHSSLRRLGVDCIDLFQFHGIQPGLYDHVVERYLRKRNAGSGRARSAFWASPKGTAATAPTACLGRPSPTTTSTRSWWATTCWLPVRSVRYCRRRKNATWGSWSCSRCGAPFPDPVRLEKVIAGLKERGLLAPGAVPDRRPLDWLLRPGVESVTSAAYKFAAAHPAVSSVLTGTADRSHLEANTEAMLGTPLRREDRDRILELFGHIEECVVH